MRRQAVAVGAAIFVGACAIWRPQLLAQMGQALLDVAAPPLAGGLLALLLATPYRRLCGLWGDGRLGRAAALAVCYLVLLGTLCTAAVLVAPQLAESLATLASGARTVELRRLWDALCRRLPFAPVGDAVREAWTQRLFDAVSAVLQRLFPHLLGLTAGVLKTLLQLSLGVFFSLYLLTDGPRLAAWCARALPVWLPRDVARRVLDFAALCRQMLQGWLFGQLLDCLILGVGCGLGMAALGFAFPALVGLVVGLCNLLPMVGGPLGGAVSFVLLLSVHPLQALWFVVYYLVLQQLEGRFLYPRIVGSRLGLPPLLVLFSVLCGGEVGGFLGILLALPAAAVLAAALRSATIARAQRLPGDPQTGPS